MRNFVLANFHLKQSDLCICFDLLTEGRLSGLKRSDFLIHHMLSFPPFMSWMFLLFKLWKNFHLRLYSKRKKKSIHPHVLSPISLYMNNFSILHLRTILLSGALLSYRIWNKSHFSWKCPISPFKKCVEAFLS